MLKTIIIDDEENARSVIRYLLNDLSDLVSIAGEADGVVSGVQLINEIKPDLVMLDVQLKDGTGFDLLHELEVIRFKIIFVTAFEKYAIDAIKFSAIDYLMKPVNPEELKEAVIRAAYSIENENISLKINAILSNIRYGFSNNRKIVLHTNSCIHLINVSEIIRCQAENNYTIFYLTQGDVVHVNKPLKEYESLLSDYGFVRIHKSHLINLRHAERLDKSDKNMLLMSDKSWIPVSLRRKESLIKIISKI